MGQVVHNYGVDIVAIEQNVPGKLSACWKLRRQAQFAYQHREDKKKRGLRVWVIDCYLCQVNVRMSYPLSVH